MSIASRKLNLTRDQLVSFLKDQQQVRQFELLFETMNAISSQNIPRGEVYAGPVSGASSPPSFRALEPSDIPELDYVETIGVTAPLTLDDSDPKNLKLGISGKSLSRVDDQNLKLEITGSPSDALLKAVQLVLKWAGQLSVERGGTGQSTFSNGQLLIGSGGSLAKSFLTQGANISISNNAGSITISVTGLGSMAFQNIGASGSFTTTDLKTVTVSNGIITSIA